MTLVLFLVGLLATAAGFVTIGFGIPINAFSLGNTLIISGTIAVAAGLILIGLAVAIGQLKRVAEALSGRPMPRSGRGSESVEAMVPPTARMTPAPAVVPPSPVPGRMPPPPDMPVESLPEMFAPEPPRMPEPPRAPEPRFPATASEPAPGPLDWLRAKTGPAAPKPVMPKPSMPMPSMPMPPISAMPAMPPMMAEPPMVEVQDEAPLSPRSPQRPAMPPEPAPAMEPKVWSPSRAGSAPEQRTAPRAEQPMPRATPQPPQPKEKEGFDLVWPDRQPAAPGAELRAESKSDAKPAIDMPLPPIPARPERPDKRASAPPPKPAERGPAILKSGVIDGMPYTLYADGSIEAELPNGTVKFASVDALRAHLEKQS